MLSDCNLLSTTLGLVPGHCGKRAPRLVYWDQHPRLPSDFSSSFVPNMGHAIDFSFFI